MGLFSFLSTAGEALKGAVGLADDGAADRLKSMIAEHDLGIEGIDLSIDGDKVTLNGSAPNAEAVEKAILAAGNINGVASVECNITTPEAAPEPQFYTVQSGDTLSKVAKEVYGNANRYNEIFEANKPMLSHPDKIYPGQNLRIPHDAHCAAA